jgi:hypothetical protein
VVGVGSAGSGMAVVGADGYVGGVADLADAQVSGAGLGVAGVGSAMGVAVSSMTGVLVMEVGGMAAGVPAVAGRSGMASSFGAVAAAVSVVVSALAGWHGLVLWLWEVGVGAGVGFELVGDVVC